MKLTENCIILNQSFENKTEAIEFVGKQLLSNGFVQSEYIAGMHKRDQAVSVFMGNDLAIPHATDECRQYIQTTGMVVVQVPNGVDFDGNQARLLVGLAAAGDEHMDILANIAILCSDMQMVDALVKSSSKAAIIKMINEGA